MSSVGAQSRKQERKSRPARALVFLAVSTPIPPDKREDSLTASQPRGLAHAALRSQHNSHVIPVPKRPNLLLKNYGNATLPCVKRLVSMKWQAEPPAGHVDFGAPCSEATRRKSKQHRYNNQVALRVKAERQFIIFHLSPFLSHPLLLLGTLQTRQPLHHRPGSTTHNVLTNTNLLIWGGPNSLTSLQSRPQEAKPFICFTSRLSHFSSMRLYSRSILSPARSDKPPVSLSTSLSRRLRTNGSMRGGGSQSPMFPATVGKKRGCAFENPEPSSPKVTCIGQVRVKTKKQGKKMKLMRKKMHSNGNGEVSFRKIEHAHEGLTHQNSESLHQDCLPHRNQRWAHFPFTICEALRTFGAEFNCFLPCKSSCFSNSEREKGEKSIGLEEGEGISSSSSCGAVFRWFVTLHEGEGKTKDIELVVGEDEDGEERRGVGKRESSERTSVFYDMEFKNEICEVKNEEEPRVSICIPPKNALLLMRCRSDPLRMAALANKLWDSPLPTDNAEEEADEEEEEDDEEAKEECAHEDEEKDEVSEVRDELERGYETTDERCEEDLVLVKAIIESQETIEDLTNYSSEEGREQQGIEEDKECRELRPEEDSEKQDIEVDQLMEAEIVASEYSVESIAENPEMLVDEVNEPELINDHQNQDEERETSSSNRSTTEEKEQGQEEESPVTEQVLEEEFFLLEYEEGGHHDQSMEERESEEEPKEDQEEKITENRFEESDTTHEERWSEKPIEERGNDAKEEEIEMKLLVSNMKQQQERESSVLPDCLLLMMCEPKLSMEVSKETWVCSTDFIRWLPARHRNKKVNLKDGIDELKKRVSTDCNPPPPHPVFQPPRSSCSFPLAPSNTGVSMASVIDQKLLNAVPFEPFGLTRCKSEPMRSSANFFPDLACFWKNSELEPHRPATFGVSEDKEASKKKAVQINEPSTVVPENKEASAEFSFEDDTTIDQLIRRKCLSVRLDPTSTLSSTQVPRVVEPVEGSEPLESIAEEVTEVVLIFAPLLTSYGVSTVLPPLPEEPLPDIPTTFIKETS
ncbi:hypothetical protein Nepgr_007452 [Nepenthes gracilis]|uniref:Uncharacterized protein n=1 Tax=Nepenthes gracilis TaxID=150966 RepID=A0AAD3S7U9_NEPGR|nr:hypothetical protein Nepgr_007452 [Nepenthes gracilis]